jgi:hypothetical protein
MCSDLWKITHLPIALIQCSVLKAEVQIPAIFEPSSETLLFKKDHSPIGTLEENGLDILRGLSEEQSIGLQLLCTIELNRKALVSKPKLSSLSAYLSIIIYGPLDLFEDVGKFVEECDTYLQDPHGCDRNVKYRNPHRLSGLDPDVPMTLDLVQLTINHEKAPSPVDLLAGFESDEFLPVTEAPSALRTALYK